MAVFPYPPWSVRLAQPPAGRRRMHKLCAYVSAITVRLLGIRCPYDSYEADRCRISSFEGSRRNFLQ